MPFIVPALPYIAAGLAGAGGALSGTKGARKGEYSSTTTPIEPTEYGPLFEQLMKFNMGRIGSSTDLTGYQAGGIQDINSVYDLINQQNQNMLTKRGLSTSPVAAAVDVGSETARGGEIAKFVNTIPLIRRQLENQDYSNALSLFGMRPLGQTVSGYGIQPGSMAGNLFSDMGTMLAYMLGKGVIRGGSGGSSVPFSTDVLAGLGG